MKQAHQKSFWSSRLSLGLKSGIIGNLVHSTFQQRPICEDHAFVGRPALTLLFCVVEELDV